MRRSKQYVLVDGKLWRKNAKEEILMKCITQEDGKHLLDQIHSSSCGNHAASRTLVGEAFRTGFYWPSAIADTEKLVRHREGSQRALDDVEATPLLTCTSMTLPACGEPAVPSGV